ncbi:hypothetical protein GGR54DRAFT_628800 [Hypoxylon sp. NC1633]|nr:hypothetical protein GGR54DRAFT_628800 [Hypoxylon sp. NC1633]
MASSIPSIAKLGPEILIEIFEHLAQDDIALCCRKWHPLALSVLYSDVVLNQKRLAKFVHACTDHEVRSLTVRLDAIPVNHPDLREAAQTAVAKLEALQRLALRIKGMNPLALSISVDVPYPYIAANEISSILDNLPASCTSLELDMRHGTFILGPGGNVNYSDKNPHPRLCNSIRSVLPQLQHLRLRLPTLCPAIFSVEAPGQQPNYRVTRATMLRTCVINLSMREPGYVPQAVWSTSCSDDTRYTPYFSSQCDLPSALPQVLPVLKDFARLNCANLKRLWVIDLQQQVFAQPHSWAGWVRRDVISNTSFPIPAANIGGFCHDTWFARVPASTDPKKTQDWVSLLAWVAMVAEGNTWTETTSGTRLPMAMLRAQSDTRVVRTREQFEERESISCMLWSNEKKVGEHILPKGPGELMKQWNLSERMPDGWTRHDSAGSSFVRR